MENGSAYIGINLVNGVTVFLIVAFGWIVINALAAAVRGKMPGN